MWNKYWKQDSRASRSSLGLKETKNHGSSLVHRNCLLETIFRMAVPEVASALAIRLDDQKRYVFPNVIWNQGTEARLEVQLIFDLPMEALVVADRTRQLDSVKFSDVVMHCASSETDAWQQVTLLPWRNSIVANAEALRKWFCCGRPRVKTHIWFFEWGERAPTTLALRVWLELKSDKRKTTKMPTEKNSTPHSAHKCLSY